jgi:hypothetical protein
MITSSQYNEDYEKRKAELTDGDGIPSPFVDIPCEYHTIPKGFPARLQVWHLPATGNIRHSEGNIKESQGRRKPIIPSLREP